jgi:HEAT repeat protein
MLDAAKFTRKIRNLPLISLLLAGACFSPMAYANGWEHTSIDFEVLVKALNDANPNVRLRAAESLGFRAQAVASDALLARLDGKESVDRVRQEIFTALGKIGAESALGAIEACLSDETSAAVRAQCAGALGNIDSASAEQLARKGANDRNMQVRLQAIKSLGSFSSTATVRALTDLIRDENTSIRRVALLSLGRGGSAEALTLLVEALQNATSREQTLVLLQALTWLANPDAIEAIQALYRQNADEEIRRHALVAMASTRAQGSETYFLEALSSEDPASRILGLVVLRNFGGRNQVATITRHALIESDLFFKQDGDELLRQPARTIASLELLNEYLRTVIWLDPQAGQRLYLRAAAIQSIPRSSSTALKIAQGLYNLRWQAIYGLGYTGTPEAAAAVAAALEDSDARIRAVATRSLGVLGQSDYLDSVVAMLNDSAAEVRWTAARVLGRAKSRTAGDALLRSLDDINAQVRLEAALALGYLDAGAAKTKLSVLAAEDSDPRVREAAVYAGSLIN